MANQPDFLAHHDQDHVAVAVRDIKPGPSLVSFLDGSDSLTIEVSEEIPLSHKVALVKISEGESVIEYGLPVARATEDIDRGNYIHTHNVRSARWHNSVA